MLVLPAPPVEDSWRIRPNVTINYGLRCDYITPWAEEDNQITTFVQGVESTTFPGAPLGYLVPWKAGEDCWE